MTLAPGASLLAAGTTFSGPSAAFLGGVLYADAGSLAVLVNCSLGPGPTALNGGGAIWAGQKAFVALLDTAVVGATALTGSGGGAYLSKSAVLLAVGSAPGSGRCALRGCAAAAGSGGFAFLEQGASFWAAACDVSGNSAAAGGGAYASGGNHASQIQLAPSGISPFPPGYLEGLAGDPAWAQLTIPASLSAYNLLGYSFGNGTTAVNTASVLGLTSLVQWDVYLSTSTAAGNSAGKGGLLYCAASSSCGLVSVAAGGNLAEQSGGLVYSASGFQVTLAAVNASQGYAGLFGGAGFVSSCPRVALSGSAFSGNTAVLGGGALFLLNATATLDGCAFTGNAASSKYPKGGALHVRDASAVSLTGCSFSANAVVVGPAAADSGLLGLVLEDPSSTVAGGAVYGRASAGLSASISFASCALDGNSAGAGLGGAAAADGQVALSAAGGLAAGASVPSSWTRNSAAFGGVFSLTGGASLTLAPGTVVSGNSAGAGAVVGTDGTCVFPQASAALGVSNNSASSYGPYAASPAVTLSVASPPAAVRSGVALPPLVASLFDAFGQALLSAPSPLAQIACAPAVNGSGPPCGGAVLGGQTVAVYSSAPAPAPAGSAPRAALSPAEAACASSLLSPAPRRTDRR